MYVIFPYELLIGYNSQRFTGYPVLQASALPLTNSQIGLQILVLADMKCSNMPDLFCRLDFEV